MRLTIMLLTASIFQVTANTTAQTVTYVADAELLTSIFPVIEQQTGYLFFYGDQTLAGCKPVTVRLKNTALKKALAMVFAGQPLDYVIQGNTIFVTRKIIGDAPAEAPVPPQDVSGMVRDSLGNAIEGASVRLLPANKGAITDATGLFRFTGIPPGDHSLEISFVGYRKTVMKISVSSNAPLMLNNIVLHYDNAVLEEYSVLSTGYQSIPKERATGSFAKVENALINRSVTTNIMDRMDGVVSGMLFNRGAQGDQDPVLIRGRNTIFANAAPLVVLDGFPFDGDISRINPNDIESITVLKDAAAASIWGARAGNGVIVLTSKRGQQGQPQRVSLTSNFTIGARPDLYAAPRMSSADYIEFEQWLFDNGFFTSRENSANRSVLPEAVEIMIRKRDGLIDDAEAERQLDILRNSDVRDDFKKYFYRNSINQQHAVNVSGGGHNYSYYLSTGWDKNLHSLVGNEYDRLSLNTLNTFRPVKNLEITAGINYVKTRDQINNPGQSAIQHVSSGLLELSPYARLADPNGNPASIPRDYRAGYKQSAANSHLLDWEYRPLAELALADNTRNTYDTRLQAGIRYTLPAGLSAELKYQYQKALTESRDYKSIETYEMRSLINRFTQINADGSLSYPVPLGGSLALSQSDLASNAFRAQLNFNRKLGAAHEVNIIAGYEAREMLTKGSANKYYGYDDDLATRATVDFQTFFPTNPGGTGSISSATGGGTGESVSQITNRYLSYFTNGAYTLRSRYTISFSARKDASNLFGVRTNQRSVPLWSAGLAWNISNEGFYKSDLLPFLKLRATYGFNGNTLNNVTAYLTTYYLTSSLTGVRNAVITAPANPDLRWERIRMMNFGLDFAFRNDRVSGSLEYFFKKGFDIMGEALLPPSAGIGTVRRNISDTRGQGFDLVLNTRNLSGRFQWNTQFLLSYARDIVSAYDVKAYPLNYIQSGAGTAGGLIYPQPGYPVFSLYSFRFGGLDPATGDPTGYVDGERSGDYNKVINETKLEDMIFHGSAVPEYFGGIRNDFSWRFFSLSVNIIYKMNYYFRRNSLGYNGATYWSVKHAEYTQRWQKPGDELITSVPSRPQLPFKTNRDNLYSLSDINVLKGDHIRLQDVRLGYTFGQQRIGNFPIQNLEAFLFASQLGLLWRANGYGLDPDNQVIPPVASLSLGIKAAF